MNLKWDRWVETDGWTEKAGEYNETGNGETAMERISDSLKKKGGNNEREGEEGEKTDCRPLSDRDRREREGLNEARGKWKGRREQ